MPIFLEVVQLKQGDSTSSSLTANVQSSSLFSALQAMTHFALSLAVIAGAVGKAKSSSVKTDWKACVRTPIRCGTMNNSNLSLY